PFAPAAAEHTKHVLDDWLKAWRSLEEKDCAGHANDERHAAQERCRRAALAQTQERVALLEHAEAALVERAQNLPLVLPDLARCRYAFELGATADVSSDVRALLNAAEAARLLARYAEG